MEDGGISISVTQNQCRSICLFVKVAPAIYRKLGGIKMTPLFLVITENKAFAQLCRKALYKRRLQSSKLASACLSNGRKSVTALSPDYVLLDGDCQDNMDDYIISLAPRYSVPIIYLTIQHNNKYPMMQAGLP